MLNRAGVGSPFDSKRFRGNSPMQKNTRARHRWRELVSMSISKNWDCRANLSRRFSYLKNGLVRFALCIILVTSVAGVNRAEPADTVLLLKSGTPGGDATWLSTIEEINSWPSWKLGDEPPLSIGRAIAIAMKDLVRKKEAKLWSVEAVHVQRPVQHDARIDPRREFFFVVQFVEVKALPKDEQHFEAIVTMGGKLMERRLEPNTGSKRLSD